MTTQDLIQGFIEDLESLDDVEKSVTWSGKTRIQELISKYQRLLEGEL